MRVPWPLGRIQGRIRRCAGSAVALVALTAGMPSVIPAQESEPAPPPPVVPTAFAQPGVDSLAFDSLRAGMLLRLTAPGVIHRRTGVIESRFADTLVIRGVNERELVRVQRNGIEWAQVSAGRAPSRWTIARGGAIGFVAGLGIARVLQHTLERDGDARDACPVGFSGIDCGMSPSLFISGIAIGTAVGMVVGSRQVTDQWRSVAIR